MKAESFVYWLQGYFEVDQADRRDRHGLSVDQVDVIRRHLNMVFVHEIDPSMGDRKHREELTKAHDGTGGTYSYRMVALDKTGKELPCDGPVTAEPTQDVPEWWAAAIKKSEQEEQQRQGQETKLSEMETVKSDPTQPHSIARLDGPDRRHNVFPCTHSVKINC